MSGTHAATWQQKLAGYFPSLQTIKFAKHIVTYKFVAKCSSKKHNLKKTELISIIKRSSLQKM